MPRIRIHGNDRRIIVTEYQLSGRFDNLCISAVNSGSDHIVQMIQAENEYTLISFIIQLFPQAAGPSG